MSEKTRDKGWKNPEGSGDILGGNWQEAEEKNASREQINDDLVDMVTGGLSVIRNQSKKRKKKRDDILLPEI